MVATDVHENRRLAGVCLDRLLESTGFTLQPRGVTDLRSGFVARFSVDLGETIEQTRAKRW